MAETLAAIKGWENFYVITGSSAAGLTGLTFVVIALASEAKMVRLSGLRAFMTPTVIHFGSVLWIASVLSIPRHTAVSLAVSMVVTGIGLTLYSVMTIYRMFSNRRLYKPAVQDWIWNATLPSICCLSLIAAGILVIRHSVPSLYLIGAVTLAMLFIGVHNAWDLAVWITVERPGLQNEAAGPDNKTPPDTRP
jgi:hypothetical protein